MAAKVSGSGRSSAGHEGLGDLEAKDLRKSGGVTPTEFQRLTEAEFEPADRGGGAEFVAFEGDAGADALGELAAVFLGGVHGVLEQDDGVMRTGEFEIRGGGREHGHGGAGLRADARRPGRSALR